MYKVYGKPGCVYCIRAKRLLESKGVSYQYIDIDDDREAQRFIHEVVESKTVPQIFIMNEGFAEYVGGYDNLAKKLS